MNTILTLDIAHPPMASGDAERELARALSKVELSASLQILKIVHGYGSAGKGGILKTVEKNWAYQMRSRFEDVFDGASLDPFVKPVQRMCSACGISYSDIGGGGEGVTVIWVK